MFPCYFFICPYMLHEFISTIISHQRDSEDMNCVIMTNYAVS